MPEDGIKQALCYLAHSGSLMKTKLTTPFLTFMVSRIITILIKMAIKTQLCWIGLLFPCFLVAVHVLSDVIFWFYSRVSLTAVDNDTRE